MVNFKNILESVLLEASKVDILINKFGVNSYNAEALAEIAGPLTIFLANKILQHYEKDYYFLLLLLECDVSLEHLLLLLLVHYHCALSLFWEF